MRFLGGWLAFCIVCTSWALAAEPAPAATAETEASKSAEPVLPAAKIDGVGPDWVTLGEADFQNVNCAEDTWSWKDGVLFCTGKPTGVIKKKTPVTNFELVLEWNHRKAAGNSGVFVWVPEASLEKLVKPGLPKGIEVQILDHGYTAQYEKGGKKADWFSSNGDVFPVGVKMTPFPPTSPNGHAASPSTTRPRDPANGITTTFARLTAKFGSGSTAPKSAAATTSNRERDSCALNPKARQLNSVISGFGNCRRAGSA